MRSENAVLDQIRDWADSWDNVRAVILTGSRADPGRQPDVLSDYDVQVFVRDTDRIVRDDEWLRPLGTVMVRWPIRPRPTFSEDWITQLVLFDDGVRIDFQITAKRNRLTDEHDNWYKILADKDHLAESWGAPTFGTGASKVPTAEAYQDRLNAFWWDIIYVAKGLWRGELNYARYVLDSTIRFETLQPLLQWYIGVNQGWDVQTGLRGRWLHRHLDVSSWNDYTATFADSSPENNWSALFATISLVRRTGKAIGESLGYEYPDQVDRKVTKFIEMIRRLPR